MQRRSHAWRRRAAAAVGATALHALLLTLTLDDTTQQKPRVAWDLDDKPPIELTIVVEQQKEPQQQEPVVPPTVPRTTTSKPQQEETQQEQTDPASSAPPAPAAPPPPAAPSSTSGGTIVDGTPRAPLSPDGQFMNDVVVGLDAKGPQPTPQSLSDALDYQPESEQDKGLAGGALAAARATRRLNRDLAFDAVTVGLGDDWFREVRNGAQRGWQVEASDLDNPGEVSREKIAWNYIRDPSSWDDEARAALEIYLKLDQVASKDPIERLPLGNSAATGQHATSTLRQQMVDDLLRRKEAGLSVRYAFEVDVHHAADGAITAIDVLRTHMERVLVEKMRKSIAAAVASAPPAPPRIAEGGPFRSRWLFVATWFIDPPRPRLTSTNSVLTPDGTPTSLMFGSTFDVSADGIETQNFDVKHKSTAELLDVTPLRRP